MVLGIIFKIAIHLKDRHIFMPQSQEILNVSNTLPLKKKKTENQKSFSKSWSNVFN